jgi:hypothetical protein
LSERRHVSPSVIISELNTFKGEKGLNWLSNKVADLRKGAAAATIVRQFISPRPRFVSWKHSSQLTPPNRCPRHRPLRPSSTQMRATIHPSQQPRLSGLHLCCTHRIIHHRPRRTLVRGRSEQRPWTLGDLPKNPSSSFVVCTLRTEYSFGFVDGASHFETRQESFHLPFHPPSVLKLTEMGVNDLWEVFIKPLLFWPPILSGE